jgi:hypothetical protein
MRLPGPCAFTGWRRVVLPTAMLSVAAAVSAGLASTFGSGGASSPPGVVNADDPEINFQAATLVLAPANDDNFTPPGVCGGTNIAPSRCTAAIWVVNGSSHTLNYSGTACPTSPSLQVQVLSGQSNPECTAAIFVSSPPPSSSAPAPAPSAKPAPGKPGASPAPAPAAPPGPVAITGFPGARCIPSDCRLYLVLAEADGDFNAPGLCGGTADIIAPCMAASFDTVGATGGTTIAQPSAACPASGDAETACSANPSFTPYSMKLTLPPKGTPAPATPPVHGPEMEIQGATLVIAPLNDLSFDPPNTCGSWGVNPTCRCTAAVFQTTTNDTSTTYSSTDCPIDLPGDVAPCTSAAFMAGSQGKTALTNLPSSVCYGPIPQGGSTAPVIPCHVYVVLTPKDGDFNAPGVCLGYFLVSSPCTFAAVDTSTGDQQGGGTVTLTTTACVEPPGDPDIAAACTANSFAPRNIAFTKPRS